MIDAGNSIFLLDKMSQHLSCLYRKNGLIVRYALQNNEPAQEGQDMPTDLRELTADIVIAHVNKNELSSDDLLKELKTVYATLEGLGKVETEVAIQEPQKQDRKAKRVAKAATPAVPLATTMTIEEAFKPDQVACMICGKKGLITLKRHLRIAHDLKPAQYRKQFNVPKDQPLSATDYVEKRRQAALVKGLKEKMAAARTAKKAKQEGETGTKRNALSKAVLTLINSSPEGISTAELKKKTGLEGKQIRNIITGSIQQKKIQAIRRGVYAVAAAPVAYPEEKMVEKIEEKPEQPQSGTPNTIS